MFYLNDFFKNINIYYWPQTFEQYWIIKLNIYITIYYNCIIAFKFLRVEIRSHRPRVTILSPLILNLSHRIDCDTHTQTQQVILGNGQWPFLFSRSRRSLCPFIDFFLTFLQNNMPSCTEALLLKDLIMIGNADSEKLKTCKSIESV